MKTTETVLAPNGNTYTFSKWKLLEGESEEPTNVRWMKAGEVFNSLEEAIAYRKEINKHIKLWQRRK